MPLTFINHMTKSVRILWLEPGPARTERFYVELGPNGTWYCDSYTHNAWIIRDAGSGAVVFAWPGGTDQAAKFVEIK